MVSGTALRIAVEGCGHGTLNAIYASIEKSCEVKGWSGIDLLIIGGDFQAVRNATDLNCMAVPMKYRDIGDFHEYYSGARVAPYLTIFVGGNHEAGNHLWELYYGGWVAPNIYYLGAANVLRLGFLRIAGLSGIWKGYNYRKPHFERLPFNQDDVRSVYHVRELDMRKLAQIRSQVDVGLSHDWPQGIEWLGDWKWLFKRKDSFEADARTGKLGSVAARAMLDRLRPPHWFSAHLHIKYAAVVDHDAVAKQTLGLAGHEATHSVESGISQIAGNADEIHLDDEDEQNGHGANVTLVAPIKNSDEIDLDDLDEEIDAAPQASEQDIKTAIAAQDQTREEPNVVPRDLRAQLPAAFNKVAKPAPPPEPLTTITNTKTRFLALDKCLPRRDFLQLLEIEPVNAEASDQTERPFRLSYDAGWLAVTRAFAKAEPLQLGDPGASLPRDRGRAAYAPMIDEERDWVDKNIAQQGKLLVPEDFQVTAPVYDPAQPITTAEMPREYTNPHTTAFCALLGMVNPMDANEAEREQRRAKGPRPEEDRDGGGFGNGSRGGRGGGRGRGFGGGNARGRGSGRVGGRGSRGRVARRY